MKNNSFKRVGGLAKLIFAVLILAMVIFSVAACDNSKPEGIKAVTEITLTASKSTLSVGDTATITANVKPTDATDASVTWHSSAPELLTVSDSGDIVAVAPGTATVTATSVSTPAVKGTTDITINQIAVDGITISFSATVPETTDSIYLGDVVQFLATSTPANASDDVIWETSDKNIATVNASGNVVGRKSGEVTIKATSKVTDSKSASVTVKVAAIMNPASFTYELIGSAGGGVALTGYSGVATDVVFPSTLGGETVKYLNKAGYAPITVPSGFSFSSIFVPKTVNIIYSYSFSNHNQLTKVVFEEGSELNQITQDAFGNCLKLRTIELPESLKSIGDRAFANCTSMASIQLPELEMVHQFVFSGWTEDQTIMVPFKAAPGNWHENWDNNDDADKSEIAANIEFDTSKADYKYIDNDLGGITLTKYTGSETNLVVPAKVDGKTVTVLGNDLYNGNTAIINVTFEEGSSVVLLSDGAFAACTKLKTVVLPTSVTTLGGYCFNGDVSLTTINLENVAVIYGFAFYNCANLGYESLDLSSVKTFGDRAFFGCVGIKEIIIDKEAVVSMNQFVFDGWTATQTIKIINAESADDLTSWHANWNKIEVGGAVIAATISYVPTVG